MKPALLVIDMQQTFFDNKPDAVDSLEHALETINCTVDLFREKELPVIVVEDVDEPSGRVPGSRGFETTSRIPLEPAYPRIRKTSGNAFNHTELQNLLVELEVDTLILTGFAASRCVLSTSRGARDLNFTPILLRGALADYAPENIHCVEKMEELISPGALGAFLKCC